MIQYGYISPFQLKVILYQQKKQTAQNRKIFLEKQNIEHKRA